jgi:hypothetical protein
MLQAIVAVALMCGAVAVGLVLRRPTAAPTQPSRTVPAQIDRSDFPQATAPWVVVVFSSGTCHTCTDVVRKAAVLASPEVDVVEVEYRAAPTLHRKYDIQAVPILAVADADGVVHRGFVGPVTATDLWAAVADARQPGSSPEPGLGH